ncbi:hypothetical protein [Paracoccus shandongensis]|uniref:hypothetical protein n=1 Tax=Paracoccus shandongensis TaxID=2816048 RepID=UPI001A9007B3|nr:hypothetical protein [Paracoccus shandongensis]
MAPAAFAINQIPVGNLRKEERQKADRAERTRQRKLVKEHEAHAPGRRAARELQPALPLIRTASSKHLCQVDEKRAPCNLTCVLKSWHPSRSPEMHKE